MVAAGLANQSISQSSPLTVACSWWHAHWSFGLYGCCVAGRNCDLIVLPAPSDSASLQLAFDQADNLQFFLSLHAQ